MAAESILVVDDVPVNLKLTDILLRREGFQVHTTQDAEQALSLLRGFHPDLMLVDVELPGMDGLSLARRVKQDPSTRDIVVVALSGRASTGDDQKALEAGCDAYITKPVDSATLVSSIRRQLERKPRAAVLPPFPQPEPLPAAPAGDAGSADDEDLETLRRRFLEESILQCRQMLESLNKNFDVAKSARLFHQWVGAAGILGYRRVSDLAGRAEEALNSGLLDRTYLRELISDLVLGFAEPQAKAPEVPACVHEALAGKPIGMVGFGADEAERVCSALELVEARPMLFRASDIPDGLSVRNCAVVMVQVSPETLGTAWLGANSPAPAGQPLVLVGKRDQILAVESRVQTRASEFLIDGWQAEEALMRLSFALTRVAPRATGSTARPEAQPVSGTQPVTGTPQILIADDDNTVRSLVRVALQEYGMECCLASNGAEALQMIRLHRPHAAVLDVNMPQMDGYLVLAAIREEKLPVRVILLTARRHENDVSRGFTLGADDYIVKPFNEVELVARLKRLLRR